MIYRWKNETIRYLRESAPLFCRWARYVRQGPFVILHRLGKQTEPSCRRVSTDAGEHLFGYYDKCPWDAKEGRMLSLGVPFTDRHPTVNDPAMVKLVDAASRTSQDIAETRAWNLQLGCRLQWVGPENQTRLLYNDYRDGRLISVILDISSGSECILPMPVFDVSRDGKTALTLDFERLHLLRPGYGYDTGRFGKVLKEFPESNGIWKMDIPSGRTELLFSLASIARQSGHDNSSIRNARFNHIMISPSGDRFMFLYRFQRACCEWTRLYTAGMDGSGLTCLTEDALVSHAAWKNKSELLVWCQEQGGHEGFHLFQDRRRGAVAAVGKGVLWGDGHPSYCPCGRYILTDTYDDRARRRHLLLYDTRQDTLHRLGAFFSPFRYSGSLRCDLHPRWSPDGGQICFDAAWEGSRQVYLQDNPLGNCKQHVAESTR